MSGRILFHVQHLLGIGHVKRAAVIARTAADAGLEVTVALGGPPVPGVDFGAARIAALPAAFAADADFKRLVDADGKAIDDAWRAKRREALLGLFARVRPDVLLFELFPFGRRQFRFEILPLLETAAGTAVACSVRDILVAKPKPERNREVAETVRRWFHRVLVHGDPAVVPFEATFPEAAAITERIVYTGYVVDEPPLQAESAAGRDEVLISAGGGSVGADLYRTALAAKPLSRLRDRTWRLLVGRTWPPTLPPISRPGPTRPPSSNPPAPISRPFCGTARCRSRREATIR